MDQVRRDAQRLEEYPDWKKSVLRLVTGGPQTNTKSTEMVLPTSAGETLLRKKSEP